MSEEAFKQVTSLLPKLTEDELAALRQRLSALRSMGPAPSTNGCADPDLVLHTLCDTLCGLGVEFSNPAQLKRTQGFKAFVPKAEAVMQFIRKAASTRNQQRALLGLGIRLLYDNLKGIGCPVSSRLVMAHLHRLPSVVNQSFPSYAESGLLGMLIANGEPR
jgi:hypothetical protein